MASSGEIGTLSKCPRPGDSFVLAGKAWKALRIDEERKVIHVVRTAEAKIRSWGGSGRDIHGKVIGRMRHVLEEDVIYPYLQPKAVELLQTARQQARENKLPDQVILQAENNSFLLLPWSGTKELRTVEQMLTHGLKEELGIASVENGMYYLLVTASQGLEKCREKLQKLLSDICGEKEDCLPDRFYDSFIVLGDESPRRIDKYDYMVPEALLRQAYLHNHMDMGAALSVLKKMG